jgi:Xaa-Pro dipeptidase
VTTKEVESIRDVPSLISDFFGRLPRVLAFEFDVIPVQVFNFYRTLFPVQEYVDGSALIMDETRMFTIGDMPWKAMEACKAEIEIHNTVLEKVKPGIAIGELYEISRARAKSLGYEEQFLGPPGYKVTFIGHAVGLELVEAPIIAKGREDRLLPGMTIALEPKMVFQNEFSAGIESVFLVTEEGCRLISKTPVKIFVC